MKKKFLNGNMFECNFSLKHYFDVLKNAKNNYDVIGPVKILKTIGKKNSYVILRHDIDFSLKYAIKLARLEAKNEIISSYFILLHSQFYNALEKKNMSLIREMSDLGHEIGLHYDTEALSNSTNKAVLQIKNEAKILGEIAGQEIKSVVQHNPTTSTKIDPKITSGFFDVMQSGMMNNHFYISDSVHNWRKGCMCNHVGKIEKLLILTHPIWWHDVSMSTRKILELTKKNCKKDIDSEYSSLGKLYENYFLSVKNNHS